MRMSLLSFGLLALAACRNTGDSHIQGNPAQTASIYTAEHDSTATKDARPQTHQSKEFEAPQRLAGFLPQLDRMSQVPLADFNRNATAYKFQLSHVIDAMAADLTRARLPEGTLREQGQRTLDELGGGTGNARQLTEPERQRHIREVRELIQTYQTAMQTKRAPGQTR